MMELPVGEGPPDLELLAEIASDLETSFAVVGWGTSAAVADRIWLGGRTLLSYTPPATRYSVLGSPYHLAEIARRLKSELPAAGYFQWFFMPWEADSPRTVTNDIYISHRRIVFSANEDATIHQEDALTIQLDDGHLSIEIPEADPSMSWRLPAHFETPEGVALAAIRGLRLASYLGGDTLLLDELMRHIETMLRPDHHLDTALMGELFVPPLAWLRANKETILYNHQGADQIQLILERLGRTRGWIDDTTHLSTLLDSDRPWLFGEPEYKPAAFPSYESYRGISSHEFVEMWTESAFPDPADANSLFDRVAEPVALYVTPWDPCCRYRDFSAGFIEVFYRDLSDVTPGAVLAPVVTDSGDSAFAPGYLMAESSVSLRLDRGFLGMIQSDQLSRIYVAPIVGFDQGGRESGHEH